MVSTRLVIAFDFLVVIFTAGADWLVIGSPRAPGANSYLLFDVYGMLSGYLRGEMGQTCAQSVLSPLILGSWGADATLVVIPVAGVLGALAFVWWKSSLYAGIALIVGALFWISGVASISQTASVQLMSCTDVAGSGTSLRPILGPYFAIFAGVLFIATYFLTEGGRLDPPLDSSPPQNSLGSR